MGRPIGFGLLCSYTASAQLQHLRSLLEHSTGLRYQPTLGHRIGLPVVALPNPAAQCSWWPRSLPLAARALLSALPPLPTLLLRSVPVRSTQGRPWSSL